MDQGTEKKSGGDHETGQEPEGDEYPRPDVDRKALSNFRRDVIGR